jgi:hypothetical protein
MGPTPPAHLIEPQSNGKVFWDPSCRSFKTREFWRGLWSGSAMVENVAVDAMPDGWRHWRDFERAVAEAGKGIFPSDAEALDRDGGEYLGFLRITARRTEERSENFYDSALGAIVGVDR